MKFDIFDDSTWKLDVIDQERVLTNKAIGSIGQLIGEIKELKSKIEKAIYANDNKEFSIAKQLKAKYPDAYTQMAIECAYPDNETKNMIDLIDQVLSFWKDVQGREQNWRSMAPSLEKLKPFLKEDYYNNVAKNIDNLASIKVIGNDAWKAYLDMATSLNIMRNDYNLICSRYSETQDRPEYAR
jgi:hypothetical protein